jgi:hypothetical protein
LRTSSRTLRIYQRHSSFEMFPTGEQHAELWFDPPLGAA